MKITKYVFTIFLGVIFLGIILVIPTKKEQATATVKATSISEVEPTLLNDEEFKPKIFDIADNLDDEPSVFEIELIDVFEIGNNYRKDEVIGKSGETWLGLFRENGKFELRNSKIKIQPESRPNYGYEDSVTIKLKEKSDPIFLLRNADTLTTGEVKTLFHRPSFDDAEILNIELKPLEIGFSQEFKIGNQIYTLKVKPGLTNTNRKVSVLILETEGQSQIIDFNSYYEKGDNIGELLWVGDLDKDGKLDLYFDFYTFEKGGFGSSLFLSSKAEKGKLVKEVASFETLGC